MLKAFNHEVEKLNKSENNFLDFGESNLDSKAETDSNLN